MAAVGCLYDRDRSIRNRGGQCADSFAKQSEQCHSRRNGGLPHSPGKHGAWGGYVPMIVQTLVFDNAQITSKLNYSHPTWGGNAILSQAQPDRQ